MCKVELALATSTRPVKITVFCQMAYRPDIVIDIVIIVISVPLYATYVMRLLWYDNASTCFQRERNFQYLIFRHCNRYVNKISNNDDDNKFLNETNKNHTTNILNKR